MSTTPSPGHHLLSPVITRAAPGAPRTFRSLSGVSPSSDQPCSAQHSAQNTWPAAPQQAPLSPICRLRDLGPHSPSPQLLLCSSLAYSKPPVLRGPSPPALPCSGTIRTIVIMTFKACPTAQRVKNLHAMQETQEMRVWSPGREDPRE